MSENSGYGLKGGRIETLEDGSKLIYPPMIKGGALVFHPVRDPEVEGGYLTCSRCKGLDITIIIEFPGGGESLKFCRNCLDRPSGRPYTIRFQ